MEHIKNLQNERETIEYILTRTNASLFEGISENIDVLMWKDFCYETNLVSLLTGVGGININYKIRILKEYQSHISDDPDHYKVLIIKQRKGSTFCSFIAFRVDLFYREMYVDLLCTKPIDYEDDNPSVEKIHPCQRCQTNGYATMLLFAAIFETIKKGRNLRMIALEALHGNKTFYEKFGFQEKETDSTIKMESKNPIKTANLCMQYLEKIKEKIIEKDDKILMKQLKKRKQNEI